MKSKVHIKRKADKAITEIEKIAKSLSGPNQVKVGLPKGSNDYPDGTSVIMVGAVHEFGSPSNGVPERSYLRSTINDKRLEYYQDIKKLMKQVVDGKLTTEVALDKLGMKIQTDIRDKITDIKEPSLKYREGNPLVLTGHLRQSIFYIVGDSDDN